MDKPTYTDARAGESESNSTKESLSQESEDLLNEAWISELCVLISRHSHLGITHGDMFGMTVSEMRGVYRRLLRESGNNDW